MHSLAFICQISLFQDQSSTWNTDCCSKWRRQRVWPACTGLSSSTRNGTHSRGATKSTDLQQVAEKNIHFRRCQRTTDRQGAVLSEYTATWFAPMWQNNQNRRVSYCFVACIYNEVKACWNENWYNLIYNHWITRYPVFSLPRSVLKRFENYPDSAISHLSLTYYSLCALFRSPLIISLSDNPK